MKNKLFSVALILFLAATAGLRAQDIFDAIEKNDLAKVKALIAKDPRVKDQLDLGKMSPLHHALWNKNTDLLRLLIQNGADVNIVGPLGRTPLIHGIIGPQIPFEMISALVDAGAQIETKDSFGIPPLLYAVQSGRRDVVDLLISKNANISLEPPNGRRLLVGCIEQGYKDLLNRLIAKGADLQTNGLLRAAASAGQTEMIEILLSRHVDIEQRSRGWTPLHFASYKGQLAAMELLLAKGADLNARTEGLGQSCANLADENGKKKAVDLLAKKGLRLSPAAFPELRGEYLGQKKPGRKAEAFAPGIVNVPITLHSNIVFSPDGREAYWSFAFDNNRTMVSRLENGRWTYPRQAVVQGISLEDVPVFHPNGTAFYDLARRRPYPDGQKRQKEDIWIWQRSGFELKNPKPLPEEVNSLRHHWQFAVDRQGNIYFPATIPGSAGFAGLCVCRFEEGIYKQPVSLGKNINVTGGEGFPFIAPDGEYILFVRNLDIYVSFRDKGGQWTPAQALGPDVNTPGMEILPTVSPDGKYLFFKRDDTLYWIDAGMIDDLKPIRD
jgi:ankyrin repeat protein